MSTKTTVYFVFALLKIVSTKTQLRILQGEPDKDKLFPFAVALELEHSWDPRFHTHFGVKRGCSGSMITDIWVITAGHCVSSRTRSPYAIRYGNVTVPREETAFSKVLQWVEHPYFQQINVGLPMMDQIEADNKQATKRIWLQNDISMMRVERVPINIFAKLSALDFASLIGQRAKYAGYGLNDVMWSKNGFNQPLQFGEAAIVKCHQPSTGFPSICIASKCNEMQLPYFADSGGPIIVAGKLVGVCSRLEGPEVIYTPVSPYLTWIRDTLNTFK